MRTDEYALFSAMGAKSGFHRRSLMFTDWTVYDRIWAPAGVRTPDRFRFCVIPLEQVFCELCGEDRLGSFARGNPCPRCSHPLRQKGEADTNLYLSQRFPQPMAFALTRRLYFLFDSSMRPADVEALERYKFLLLWGRKIWTDGPLARFPNVTPTAELTPRSFAVYAPDERAAESQRRHLESQGVRLSAPAFEPAHALDVEIPWVVDPDTPFAVEVIGEPFQTDPLGPGINFMAVMEGVACHGIQ